MRFQNLGDRRSNERSQSTRKKLKFAKPKSEQDSAKWEGKSQGKDCTLMNQTLLSELLSTPEYPRAHMCKVKGPSLGIHG